jgi:hypothetical protein
MSYRMPFGKHKGQLLSELPLSYLLWLSELDDLREPLRSFVDAEMDRRNGHGKRENRSEESRYGRTNPRQARGLPQRDITSEIVETGYRSLAMRHHPDHGGSTATMQAVNTAVAWLRERLRDLS